MFGLIRQFWCLLTHKYRVVKDTYVYLYFECDTCQRRFHRRMLHGCHQPLDKDWLDHRANATGTDPSSG